jgi:hypothetical protein
MPHTPPKSDFDSMRDDLEAKQRATLYPDTVRAGRNIDEFLWKGDPKETKVQRAGLGVFALAYIFLGLLFFCGAFSDVSILFDSSVYC